MWESIRGLLTVESKTAKHIYRAFLLDNILF